MSIGGCETGPVALHPDRPTLIYSGCYGGVIDRWNKETGETRNMMVYPQLQLGAAPKNLRERFQWVAPIVVSPHDPDVVYHASQHIWRSTDRGMSWERISDDLTTDTPEHQEPGGEPITAEGTGVEVYNTVFALTVSPHTPDDIWAGTDDGRVWISRDAGGEWTEVTPSGFPEMATVNRIEVSPHDPAKAYLAAYRYRRDDWHPYIYRTENHGQDWELITSGDNGIPADFPTRVVREDPDREGLLYAGTEFGMFVSFDDGERWQPFQLDLPVTPVTDLKVHRKDLVVATQGRSFWILDDLSPLHELDDEVAAAAAHLYQPRDAYLVDPSGGGGEYTPEGPPRGAQIFYALGEESGGEVTLDILDQDGRVLRTFSSDPERSEELGTARLDAERGLNRVAWNLRTEPVETPEGAVVWGYTGGVKVLPGSYTARLTVDGMERTRSFQVLKDPRLTEVTMDDLVAQRELARSVRDTLASVYDVVRRVRAVRDQVEEVVRRGEDAGLEIELLTERAEQVAESLTAVEERLLQVRAEAGQDPINYPPQLDNQYAYLLGLVNGPTGRPTEGAYQRFDDLNADWTELRAELDIILRDEVAELNQLAEEAGITAVLVPVTGR